MENKLYIVMYHYIRDLQHSRYPEIKGLDIRDFRKQIEFLTDNFQVVTMEAVIDAVERGASLPPKACLLTFDDGYIDNYTYALPILEEFGVQGSFFIPGKTFTEHKLLDVNKIHYILASADIHILYPELLKLLDSYRGQEFDFPSNEELIQSYAEANRFDSKEVIFVKRILQTALPERLRNHLSSDLFQKYVGISEKKLAYELYMTREQIHTLKRHGMFIGLHGYDHYWLANLSEKELQQDIDKSLEALDEFIDHRKWVMNYPYGNYSDSVIQYISAKGACMGLTTEVRIAVPGQDSVFCLPRLDAVDFPPRSERYLQIS